MRELSGVRSLLEAGANPNNTGDPQGIARTGSRSFFPSELHGISPVDILHQFDPPYYPRGVNIPGHKEDMDRATYEIENLLRSYGASPPKEGWWGKELEVLEVQSDDTETS